MSDYNINITATDRTGRELNNIQGALGGLTSGANRFRAALGAAAGAFAAIGAVNIAQNAIDQFTAYESLNTQLVTYLGSQEAATNEMARLRELANSLPQDLGDVANAFTILTRTGVDTSTESLTAFSNIATANAKSLEQLAEAVADGMTGEFERFKEFGIKVSKEGDTLTATLGDQQVAVSNSASDLVNQLIALGAEGGRFGGAAAANADTLSQSFSNLNGALFEGAIAFGEGIKPGLQDVTRAITTLVTENSGLIESFGSLISDALMALPGMFTNFLEAVAPLQPVFELLGSVLTNIIMPGMSALFEILGQVAVAITPIVDAAIPAMQAGFEGLVIIVERIVGFFTGMADSLGAVYDRAIQLKDGVVGTFQNMGDRISTFTENASNRITESFNSMYMDVVGGSIVPDMVDGVIQEFLRMSQGMTETSTLATTSVQTDFQKTATVIQEDFMGTLQSALSDGKLELNDFRGFFQNTLQKILTDALTKGSGINNALTGMFSGLGGGGGGGFLGGLFGGGGGGGFFSNIFGGLFGRANGGAVGMGTPYVVGEQGPELFVPNANGSIVSNGALGGGNVTFNINAIDTQSGTQFLLDNKQSIVHMIQQAGHKRGKEIF